MPLIPPPMFATVEEGVFRSSMPSAVNMQFVDTLKLKAVIALACEPFEAAVRKKFTANGTQVLEFGKECWVPDTNWTGLSEVLVKKAIEAMLDTDLHPMLLCCTTGVHLTGATVSCLRKLQGWCITSVLEEYRSYAEPLHRTSCMHFINQYDVSLIAAPPNPPAWYLSQIEHDELDSHYFTGVHSPEAVNYSSHDPRPAYRAFYFCTMAPPVSGKVCYDMKKDSIPL
eukprot:TRINITY_DN19592_c0_g1_i1.p1 TRINITY_DN19592_c0_g1~~TRINITY_DN19592_c0_g1_i1.p1  ORF type:complete len:227 (+),score=47.96 TRINITY_DN19592_c0_g1_i1:54-734(+)